MKRVVERSGNGWDLKAQTTSIDLYDDSIRLFQKETQVQNLVVRYEDLIDRDPKTVSLPSKTILRLSLFGMSPTPTGSRLRHHFHRGDMASVFDRSFAGIGAETLDVDELDYVQDVLSGVYAGIGNMSEHSAHSWMMNWKSMVRICLVDSMDHFGGESATSLTSAVLLFALQIRQCSMT